MLLVLPSIQLSFESAKEVVLEGVCNEVLPKIFTYDSSTLMLDKEDNQLKRLQDISNAFGLLLCHFRDIPSEKTHQKLIDKVGNLHFSFEIHNSLFFPVA